MAGRWRQTFAAVAHPRFDRILVPVALALFALARAGQFEERDPYWQARAGMENFAGLPLARPDSWSWVGIAGDWYQNSPLWNTLLGLGYSAGGFWGLFAVTAALMLAYFAVVYALALRIGGRRLPGLLAILATVAPVLAMLSPRATLMVEVLMLASVLAVLELSRRDLSRLSAPLLGLVVALAAGLISAVGNQLHLSFLLLAPALGGVWAVVWLLTPLPWPRRITAAAAGGVGWVLGVAASPYGVVLGWQRVQVVQDVCAGLILEWTSPLAAGVPVSFTVAAVIAAVTSLVIAAWLWTCARQRRWNSNDTGVLALAIIGVPAAFAGWWAIRFLGISLLILAPAAAAVATGVVDLLRSQARVKAGGRWAEYVSGAFWRVVVAATTLILLPGAIGLAAQHAEPAEVAVIGQLPTGCRLFSSGAIGGGIDGTVILVRPDVTVWIDGRADFYGRTHLIEAAAFESQKMPTPVPPGTTCVLIDSRLASAQPMLTAMDAAPQWHLAVSQGAYRMFLPAG